jgi:sialic acid synthase SpsE
LYFVKDMKAGDVITEDCVRSVRPGFGLAPKYLRRLLSRKVTKDVIANTPVTEDMLNPGFEG